MKKVLLVFLCAALLLSALCACGETSEPVKEESGPAEDIRSDHAEKSEAKPAEEPAPDSKDFKADYAEEPSRAAEESGTESRKKAMPESEYMLEDSYSEPADCMPPEARYQPEPQAGMLTAGEWNDNEHYDFFMDVLSRYEWQNLSYLWRLSPKNRIAVHVSQPNSQSPAKGVTVTLHGHQSVIASAVTDADGMAYIYYLLDGNFSEIPVKVTAGNSEYKLGNENGVIEMTAEEPYSSEKMLDLLFMVDTTGSMSDELEYLKTELRDVVRRVSADNNGMQIRVSVNFYRDESDDYVVRSFEFTDNIDDVISDLAAQYADGGGDYPEAVDEAFANAIEAHEWRENSVKLAFFVLDAPPHSERQNAPTTMRRCITEAAENGIRVIPVVSSGADTEVEFLMRSAAAVTGGTYVFLTDDSGIGGSHLEPTIGQYDVEMLNSIMIRLINEYCR